MAFDAILGGHRIVGRHAQGEAPSDAVIGARLKLARPEMSFSSRCIELGYNNYREGGGTGPEAKGDVTEAALRKLRQGGAIEF